MSLCSKDLLTSTPAVSAAWDPTVIDPKCIDYNTVYLLGAAGEVFTDFVTLLLPLPVLWHLHLPRSQKVQLIGVFLTGSLYDAALIQVWISIS